MINVNMTSVCQVSFTLSWVTLCTCFSGIQCSIDPIICKLHIYITPMSLKLLHRYQFPHFPPFCSCFFSPSAVSTMVPAVSQLFPKQRWTTPTLSVLATHATLPLFARFSLSATFSLFFFFFFTKLFPFFLSHLVLLNELGDVCVMVDNWAYGVDVLSDDPSCAAQNGY